MNISDRGMNPNVGRELNQVFTKEQISAIKNADGQSANAQIARVAVGEMFRGQILDITNNQVSIALDGKGILSARMLDSVNLNIGDTLSFLVQENDGVNVMIKPQAEPADAVKDNAIFKILEGNNLMPTEKNYQIAESLMNRGMSVDKGHMQQIMQQSYKFPDASIDTLTALNKLGIEVNDANIQQYTDYMNNSHQLSGNLNSLATELADFFTAEIQGMAEAGETQSTDAMLAKNNMVLEIISDSVDMPSEAVKDVVIHANKEVGTGISNSENMAALKNNGLQDTAGNKGVPDAVGNTMEAAISEFSDKTGMESGTVKVIFDKLSSMGFHNEDLSMLAKESDTPVKLLNNINKILENNKEQIPVETVKSFFTSPEYNSMLGEATGKKFSINPRDMQEPKELDDLYNKIYEKTNKLMNTLSKAGTGGAGGETLNNTAKSVQERIDFMQNLNNMYAYAQIPVKTAGNEMNSELFVYMNKRAMKDAKDEVSALLHLDMEHLGATDVHVSLHGSTVHTRFYVEDEESARIIDEHMTMLEKAINDSGYSLTNEVIAREPSLAKPATNMVVDEMLGNDLEQSVKRYSFDIRM
ncbi:MAG: flagellar hook-length control protein FliK [Clostridium sp.]|nr:flagellar hook-length control protein FliK [Clostridium sp.]MCM1400172.1 flagellar hook-length control protein FliK [Clostridium sp.]MCM1460904.1 flagellar hook-length control protein FliK [Bacteroides sp.]